MDSLAATGTRFQRQMRPERVKPSGRARAATAGSMGAPARGHSKSLSTSNIGPIGPNYGAREDARRRPAPLLMGDPRYPYPPEGYVGIPPSPSDFSTPTSATFSTGPNSPRYESYMASPTTSLSRPPGSYRRSRTPSRRLSVPSSGNGFPSFGRPMFGPGPHGAGPPGTMGGSSSALYAPVSSLASPTSSIFSRRESVSSTEENRRRTWHMDSSNFAPGSRLSNVMKPSEYPSPPQTHAPWPVHEPQSNNTVRLPGIASFDPMNIPIRPRQASPSRSNASSMMMDSERVRRPTLLPAANPSEIQENRNTTSWDMGLHRNLTRLDITSNSTSNAPHHTTTTQMDGASSWARDANQAMDAQANRFRSGAPTVRFNEPMPTVVRSPTAHNPAPFHHYTASAPSMNTPLGSKRRGWYQTDAPAEKMARVDRMIHPNIAEFPGFPARGGPLTSADLREENSGERENMMGLRALVAVATSEGNATPAC